MIDAHQHFWQLSRPFNYDWLDAAALAPIKRDFLADDLAPLIRSVGVQRTIVVQTQHDLNETRWLLNLAERHDFIAGVVGWVDLASPACEEQLLEFKDHPHFVGVRHITQDEPDDNFIVRADVLRGLKILEKHRVPFDLLFYVKHLRHVPALASHLPGLSMVIDHLAKPHIKEHRMDDWLPHFKTASRFPNIFCKLSGMITEADWQYWTGTDIKPYVQAALECFGPSRCMFGSDWPVCTLAGRYQQVHGVLVETLASVRESERIAILAGTAERFYCLDALAHGNDYQKRQR